jgi:hypothetical protein
MNEPYPQGQSPKYKWKPELNTIGFCKKDNNIWELHVQHSVPLFVNTNNTNKTQLVYLIHKLCNTTETQPITFQTTLMTYYKILQLMNRIKTNTVIEFRWDKKIINLYH